MEYNVVDASGCYARYSTDGGYTSDWMIADDYKKWLKLYRGIASVSLPTGDTLKREDIEMESNLGGLL